MYYANATSWVGAEAEEIQNNTAGLGTTMAGIRLGVKFQADDESLELALDFLLVTRGIFQVFIQELKTEMKQGLPW